MEPGAHELANPKPKWEAEQQRVEAVLSQSYGVKPRTAEQRNILLLANGLYGKTREQVQPFLDALFDDGTQKYFSRLSGAAYSINAALSPRKGEVTEKTPEQLTEEASIGIINDLADMFDQRERLKLRGVTETGEDLEHRWKQIDTEKPQLIKSIDDLDKATKEAIESGANQTGWLMGIRVIQAKLHNKLDALDKDIKAKRPEGFQPDAGKETGGSIEIRFKPKPLSPESSKSTNETVNQLTMEAVDDIERALQAINKHEWRSRFQTAQGALINFLDEQGIRRIIPKIGEQFDAKWQMATAKNGQGDRINKIGRGAFVDKSTGRIIQEAWVETG